MGKLLLIRHGQASWGKKDYDVLSPLGHRQASILGMTLAARQVRPSTVITGGLRRQNDTLTAIRATAGWDQVNVEVDPRWREYDHQAIIIAHKPAYASMAVMKADLVRTLRPYRAFMDMFTQAMLRWAGGEHDEDYPETFTEFTARVQGALKELQDRKSDGPVVVVSSAGPICWALNDVLGGSVEAWGRLQVPLVNTSISTLMPTKQGTLVAGYNDHGHLLQIDPELATYR
ncbi:MAG: histidine phosphatase family protein [Nostocoides sp.]